MNNTNNYFNAVNERYDSFSFLAKNFELQESLLRSPGINKKGRILDLATGTGNFGGLFVPETSVVVGLDINSAMLKQAQLKGLTPVIGNVERLPFRDESFNVVLCRQLLHYLSNVQIQKVLENVYAVLKRGGKLIVHNTTAPNEDLERRFRAFMNIVGQRIAYPCITQLTGWMERAGFRVQRADLQAFSVEENMSDFKRNRNIHSKNVEERLNAILAIPDFNLRRTSSGISYNRYYAFVLGKK